MRYRGWVVVLAVMGLSCNSTGPSGALTAPVPPEYRVWFDRTVACSGRTLPFDRLQFFIVPGADFECPSGRCVGRWEPPYRIYLAEAWARSELVVRHEMLHALIGQPGHPDPPFARGCNLTWDSWSPASAGAQPSRASGVLE